jgi:hypothetical protein
VISRPRGGPDPDASGGYDETGNNDEWADLGQAHLPRSANALIYQKHRVFTNNENASI